MFWPKINFSHEVKTMRFKIIMLAFIISFNSYLCAQNNQIENENKGVRHVFSFTVSEFDKVKLESAPTKSAAIIIEKIKTNNKKSSFSDINEYGINIEKNSDSFFNELKKLEENINENDEIVMYISSHGVEVIGSALREPGSNIKDKGELLYIVTNEPREKWIPMVEIVKLFSKPKLIKQKKLIIIDSCRAYDSKDSDDEVIGKNWKNYANKTDGFGENNQEFKKFINGDQTANLNLAIMYACTSGMKSYFVEDNQFTFFSESLNTALSYDSREAYSLREIFEITKSLTIWQNKIKRNQRQEPVMVVYSDKSTLYQIPNAKSLSFENSWFFGRAANQDEKIEFDKKVASQPEYKDLAYEPQNKIEKLKLVGIEKIEKFQSEINEMQKDFSKVIDLARIKDLKESEDDITDVQRLIRTISDILGKPIANIDKKPTYSAVIYAIVDAIAKESRKINESNIENSVPLATKISNAFNAVADNINSRIETIQSLNQKAKEFFDTYKKEELVEFLKETQKLRQLRSDG